ncbi:hypothetical protein CDAR_19501 [Caerostris darwini]|uniref:Uncharacterized protein n=1 Tax=Caerostris darwini TaxID=1538125 RepID=A0AAV4WEK2_9ARAC|nr:hypothetical protein CDAR_19501 [Caerostris darwini]
MQCATPETFKYLNSISVRSTIRILEERGSPRLLSRSKFNRARSRGLLPPTGLPKDPLTAAPRVRILHRSEVQFPEFPTVHCVPPLLGLSLIYFPKGAQYLARVSPRPDC